MKKKVELFLDSGAFSAWSKGIKIDVYDYIDFIKKNEKYISLYAVLDVIGDAEGTLKNQQIMEDAGLLPMPCFHFGESFKYLKKYVNEYDYIALGGLAKKRQKEELVEFLDHCFDIICDRDGLPKIRAHGFGITSLSIMKRYPWYSVDSTSWLVAARTGLIYVPDKLSDGSWDYMEEKNKTRKISISTQNPDSAIFNQHYSTMSSYWQNLVKEWLEQHDSCLGRSKFRKVPSDYKLRDNERFVDPKIAKFKKIEDFGGSNKQKCIEIVLEKGVSNTYLERDILNIKYFTELESHFPKWPWAWKRSIRQGFGFST